MNWMVAVALALLSVLFCGCIKDEAYRVQAENRPILISVKYIILGMTKAEVEQQLIISKSKLIPLKRALINQSYKHTEFYLLDYIDSETINDKKYNQIFELFFGDDVLRSIRLCYSDVPDGPEKEVELNAIVIGENFIKPEKYLGKGRANKDVKEAEQAIHLGMSKAQIEKALLISNEKLSPPIKAILYNINEPHKVFSLKCVAPQKSSKEIRYAAFELVFVRDILKVIVLYYFNSLDGPEKALEVKKIAVGHDYIYPAIFMPKTKP